MAATGLFPNSSGCIITLCLICLQLAAADLAVVTSVHGTGKGVSVTIDKPAAPAGHDCHSFLDDKKDFLAYAFNKLSLGKLSKAFPAEVACSTSPPAKTPSPPVLNCDSIASSKKGHLTMLLNKFSFGKFGKGYRVVDSCSPPIDLPKSSPMPSPEIPKPSPQWSPAPSPEVSSPSPQPASPSPQPASPSPQPASPSPQPASPSPSPTIPSPSPSPCLKFKTDGTCDTDGPEVQSPSPSPEPSPSPRTPQGSPNPPPTPCVAGSPDCEGPNIIRPSPSIPLPSPRVDKQCRASLCTSAAACEVAKCLTGQTGAPLPICPSGSRCERMVGVNNLCVYEPRPTGYTCYKATGKCDRDVKCDGKAGQCPIANRFKPAGTLCYKAAGECEKQIMCSGKSAACPTDSDPTIKFQAAGTVCREAKGDCGSVSVCTGRASTCPFPENHGKTAFTYKCKDKIWCHGLKCKDKKFKKHPGGKSWDIGGRKVGDGEESFDELDESTAAALQAVDFVEVAGHKKDKHPPPKWGKKSKCTPKDCPNGGNPADSAFLVCKCNIDNANDPCNWVTYEVVPAPPQKGAPICPRKPFFEALD